jgi:hypothetical protein
MLVRLFLVANAEKTKYMFLSHHQNAGKCVTDKIFGNDSNKSKFDLREIKRRLNFGNAC